MLSGRQFAIVLAVVLRTLALAIPAQAADPFPSHPVRLVVPVAAGGSIDVVSRLVAQKMSEFLGQPVLVENRGGAETLIASRYVKDQPADGYTLLAAANGFLTMSALKLDPGYDPLGDFTGLGLMQTSPMILETSGSRPFNTLQSLIDFGKANPGKMSFGSGGVGSPPHVIMALMLKKADVTGTHVVYRGNGAALPDLAGGRLDLMCDGYISSLAYYAGKTIRPLAVTSPVRMASLPDVPTLKEQGIDMTYTLWLGLLLRKGTPPEAVQKLSAALRYATSSKELTERFRREGSESATDTPDEFNAFLAKDMAQAMPEILSLNIPKQ